VQQPVHPFNRGKTAIAFIAKRIGTACKYDYLLIIFSYTLANAKTPF